MSDEEPPRFRQPKIIIDRETAEILQAMENAGGDVGELARLAKRAKLSSDFFEAYAKAVGKQDDPEIKAFIQAVKEEMGGPAP